MTKVTDHHLIPVTPGTTKRAGPQAEGTVRRAFSLLYGRLARAYEPLVVAGLGYRGHEIVAEALTAHLPKDFDAPILDAGCGTGLTAAALRKRRGSLTIDGFDLARDMVTVARRRGLYRHLVVADATKPLPLRPSAYGAAMASGLYTQGHVGAEGLTPVLDILAPGGLFAFYVYAPVWKKLGFDKAIAEARIAGRIEIVAEEEEDHYRRLGGQVCRVLVIAKR